MIKILHIHSYVKSFVDTKQNYHPVFRVAVFYVIVNTTIVLILTKYPFHANFCLFSIIYGTMAPDLMRIGSVG
jgi:hypothetical protein